MLESAQEMRRLSGLLGTPAKRAVVFADKTLYRLPRPPLGWIAGNRVSPTGKPRLHVEGKLKTINLKIVQRNRHTRVAENIICYHAVGDVCVVQRPYPSRRIRVCRPGGPRSPRFPSKDVLLARGKLRRAIRRMCLTLAPSQCLSPGLMDLPPPRKGNGVGRRATADLACSKWLRRLNSLLARGEYPEAVTCPAVASFKFGTGPFFCGAPRGVYDLIGRGGKLDFLRICARTLREFFEVPPRANAAGRHVLHVFSFEAGLSWVPP